ncbi:hypothetical protein B0T17DRAFT_57394 [Bombardia bombarda]|uniref:Uncharacterized protein n=1 Tax=Bombardia bombarda TaxID=252184 RepID=A0AA39XM58_9PEZI|nr:hypothetical protein B0T17DRAFT_57394 [Bombardia bombarda]
MLLASTLRCCNEHLPVDPDETLRFRARARNWFYMDDAAGRGSYSGKSGQCARDLVGGCRRCGTVVCRNCAIKPPASIALRDRHRRICAACTKAPLGHLVRPRLDASLSLASSDDLQRAICKCASDGVWLCQPCGRTIRSDDYDYKNIWKWRHQYTDVLGGLGTGIGDGDRGVICGRGAGCCAARERAEEVDCDAEDAREATTNGSLTPSPHQQQQQQPSSSSQNNNNQQHSSLSSLTLPPWGTSSSSGGGGSGGNAVTTATTDEGRTTPSPAQLHKPGYVRQEVEGIGGRIKKKLLRIVRVGACVPEWADERDRGSILGREVQGRVRSWCGWCWRVIPGEKDYECMEGEGDVEEKKG